MIDKSVREQKVTNRITPRRGVDLAVLRLGTGIGIRQTSLSMLYVVYALLPGTLAYTLLISPRILLNLAVGTIAALAFEALALQLRKQDIRHTLRDGSAAVTGALLALSVTPLLPVWQLVVGVGVAILIAKHAYGGLGCNPFNPAMVAFAVLLVSFPADMSHWPDKADPALPAAQNPRALVESEQRSWDAITSQTPLDRLREQRYAMPQGPGSEHEYELGPEHRSEHGPGRAIVSTVGWRWSGVALAWLAGGLFLLWSRVIRWHAPGAFLLSLMACQLTASLVSGAAFNPVWVLLSGATLFGAFFIITDPVSGAATPRGRLIFGVGVGVLTFVIRQFGSWPEGFAFAILVMNSAVPLIDRLEQPRRS